jgi:hypothetical protein
VRTSHHNRQLRSTSADNLTSPSGSRFAALGTPNSRSELCRHCMRSCGSVERHRSSMHIHPFGHCFVHVGGSAFRLVRSLRLSGV